MLGPAACSRSRPLAPLVDPFQPTPCASPACPQGEPVEMLFACEPKWLEEKFPAEAAKCKRPAVALICPDKTWMT